MSTTYDYRPTRFFVVTTIATWVPWLIAALLARQAGGQGAASLLNLLGLLGPLIVALVFLFGSGSPELKTDFRDRLGNLSRIRPLELLGALAVPPLVSVVAAAVSQWFGQPADQLRLSISGNLIGMVILAMILAPIIEEFGWRGYGVDSLRSRMGLLGTSLVFGVVWSLWHAPLALLPGTYHYELAHLESPWFLVNFFVSVVPLAVFANWVYYRNNRSLLANIVLHSVVNASAVLPSLTQITKCIATVLYAIIAVALVALDRRTFGTGPRNFLRDPVADPVEPAPAHAS